MKENEKIFSGKKTFLDGKRTFFDETKEEGGEKESEIKQEPVIIEKAKRVGSFHLLEGIQEGDRVEKGQKIGYIESLKIPDEICAPADGIISNLPKEGAAIEYGEDLFTITPKKKELQ